MKRIFLFFILYLVIIARMSGADEPLRMSVVSCYTSGKLLIKIENVSNKPIKTVDYNLLNDDDTFRVIVLNSKMPNYVKLLRRQVERFFTGPPMKYGIEIGAGQSIAYEFDLYDKFWSPDFASRVFLSAGDEIVVVYNSRLIPNSQPELIWFGVLTCHGFVRTAEGVNPNIAAKITKQNEQQDTAEGVRFSILRGQPKGSGQPKGASRRASRRGRPAEGVRSFFITFQFQTKLTN